MQFGAVLLIVATHESTWLPITAIAIAIASYACFRSAVKFLKNVASYIHPPRNNNIAMISF